MCVPLSLLNKEHLTLLMKNCFTINNAERLLFIVFSHTGFDSSLDNEFGGWVLSLIKWFYSDLLVMKIMLFTFQVKYCICFLKYIAVLS